MGYLYLLGSILSGTFANVCLKYSKGYTKLWPSIGNLGGFFAGIWLLSLAVTTVRLSVAYATWAGLGIVLAAVLGKALFGETPTKRGLFGMALIALGIALLNSH